MSINFTNPLISIVIPVYKSEKYISKTIDSLFWQTNTNFEVIFVDDGSPDDSVSIIEQRMAQGTISYKLIRQKNQGLGCARNTGFSNASGQWVLFLDSDDTLQPFAVDAYEALITAHSDADTIFSKYQDVNESDALMTVSCDNDYDKMSQEALLDGFLTRNTVFLVPGTLYRVSFLKENNLYHPHIPWSEDQYFMWSVLNKINFGIYSHAVIYNYVHHSGESIMNSTPIEKILSAYNSYLDLIPQISDAKVRKYLLPRWCLGCLHIFGKRKDKKSFLEFWNTTSFSKQCKILLSFPSSKVKLLAFVGLINKTILYRILSRH